jgi:CRISPR-associated protein Cas4
MISVTLLSSYLYCARKLFIEAVLGIRSEVPKEAIVRGSIRHSIHEEINLAEESIIKSVRSSKFEDIFAVYAKEFLGIMKRQVIRNKARLKSVKIPLKRYFEESWPAVLREAEFRANRVFGFAKTTGFTGEKLWESITPKIKPEYRLESEALMLRGVIHSNIFVPVELKTGKAPKEGVWPGHKIQVGAYAMLVEEHFGVPVQKGIVRYLDTNEMREIIINPFLKEEVKSVLASVNKLLSSKEAPDFCDSDNKCKCCDLRNVCRDESLMTAKTKDLNTN